MIGKTIWVYDCNRRVYRRDENGRTYGNPIYRDSFRPVEIIGETRASWVLKWGRKIPKKGYVGVAFSEEELDQLVYVHDNAYDISNMVRTLKYAELKQVADLIKFTPKNK